MKKGNRSTAYHLIRKLEAIQEEQILNSVKSTAFEFNIQNDPSQFLYDFLNNNFRDTDALRDLFRTDFWELIVRGRDEIGN